MTFDELLQLESALDYRFSNPKLLRQALTHSSLAHEMETKAAAEAAASAANGDISVDDDAPLALVRKAITAGKGSS